MAKNIWIYSRKALLESTKSKIVNICKEITPDNISATPPKVVVNNHVAFGISNPKSTILIKNNSILMGQIIGDTNGWDIPKKNYPDGSYALFRDGKDYCEMVSDAVASRTIWYYMNEEIFIASTSQRAIILFIGEFEFNEKVIPWILSSGCLGPGYSWDKRLNRVLPDSTILLDKVNWKLTKTTLNPVEFNEKEDSDENHMQNIMSTISDTFNSVKFNYSEWILPLSGGYDSRGILCFLNASNNDNKDLRTITWGLKSSLNDTENDAFIAQELARVLDIPNKYYNTNLSDEPVENLFNRYLINGEGRIDHIGGYFDGFKIWKSLHEDGVQGVIRGDESFGWLKRESVLDVRLLLGLGLCKDFSNLTKYTKKGLFEHEIPDYLKQKEGESFSMWRDRLYQQYRIPTALAALSDLKLSYVEIVSPLLTKRILKEARKLPDHLRTEKKLFIKIVNSITPDVPFAKRDATAKVSGVLKQKQIVELISKELTSNTANELFPQEFLTDVLNNINILEVEKEKSTEAFSVVLFIKRITPRFLKSFMRSKAPSLTLPSIDYNVLAFRIYMVVKMNQMLKNNLK